MAVGTPKFPLEKISGVLGKKDRSVGKEPGLGLNISDSNGKSILGLKTAATQTRSPGQMQRSAAYCFCDEEWKKLDPQKATYCQTFHTKVRRLSYYHMTNYLCWMSLCMSAAWSETAFRLNSYITRYTIKNTTGQTWTDKKVLLTGINTKLETGTDLTILQTTFYRQPLQTLSHKAGTPGTAIVCLPEMAPSDTVYIDVYSYGDYSSPQNCTGQTPGEIDQYLLQTLSFPVTFPMHLNIDINNVAPRSGFVYMPISIAPQEGSVNFSGFNINTGTPEHVGICNNKHGILYVDLFRMGEITAGLPIIATGLLTRNNSQNYDCDCPSIVTSTNISCGSLYPRSIIQATPGGFCCCAGEYHQFPMILVEGGQGDSITPESIIQIGPT